MLLIVGSSYRTVRICVLSDVKAMGPPYGATDISMYSWLSRLNLLPIGFSEKESVLYLNLLPWWESSYQSKSMSVSVVKYTI